MASINTPPTTPEYLTVTTPSGINIDRNRKITWGASTDAEGNLRGYIVERSSDYGQSWTQIYNGTATETADYVPIEITDVMYRVKAYDSGGLDSDWRTSGNTIIPVNNAPTAPPSITVPDAVDGGSYLTIKWAAASDSDGNLSGYILERSTNGGYTYTQVYKGRALTYTDTITKGWASVTYRVKAYDSYNAQSSYTTSATRTVINNSVPTAPPSITVPDAVNGGSYLTIRWDAATDADGNLGGYILERSVNGASYTQVYKGSALTYTDTITKGWATVTYRVKAYDSYNAQSSYTTSATRTVINNSVPTAPPSITVPDAVNGGSYLTIRWDAATDADGNLGGYILERSVNGASYTQVYKGSALTYTDTITKGWATVAYRVKAYDSYNAQSGYTTSPTRTVINNHVPTISAASEIGTKDAPFAWNYIVSDVDGDKLTVTEQLDGTAIKTQRNVASGTALTFEQTNTAAGFQCLLNGDHTLHVTVSDGSLSTSKTATFTKAVYKATITLAKPLTVSTPITAAALSVTGSIPSDAAYKVEATNNALDASPVWQDVTAEVKTSRNIIFSNTTAAKGAAFNFRISVARGSSGTGGYIEAVSGAFQ